MPAHVAVHAKASGQVRLRGHCLESLLRDQPFRDFGPGGVELVRAMRCFAEKYKRSISREIEQRVEFSGGPVKTVCGGFKKIKTVRHHVPHQLSLA